MVGPAFSRERLLRGSAVLAASMASLAAHPAFAAPSGQARNRVQEFRFVAGGGASVNNLDTLDTTISGATLGIITNFNYQVGLLYLGGDSQLHYGMAESYEVSEDLKTYTFKLKPGIRWSDGSAFTPEDILYTWTRAALPATRSQAAGTNLIDIEGVDAVMSGEATTISGLSIPDDRTLVIRLRDPNVVFLYKMADAWGWGWIKKDVYERDPQAYFGGQNGLPLANGAFRIDRWIADDRLIFSRNPYFASWFGEPANLESVHFLFNRDTSTLLLSYENNELDMVSIDPQDLDRYNAPGLPHYRELKLAAQGPIVMGFRESLAPMEDPLIRLAFYQAIDRDLIGKQVYRGTWVGATSMHIPDFPFFNPELQLPKYDPTAAKDALARSTYRTARNLPPIQMSLVAGDQRGAVAMQQMWKDVLGVDVQIKTSEFPYEAAAARRHITFGGRGYSWVDVGWLPYSI